jgi:hypothetical protein
MNGSCKIGLTLAALLAGTWQPAAAQTDIAALMRELTPPGGRCVTAINDPSTSCTMPGLGLKGFGFHLQYVSPALPRDTGWGTAYVSFRG